jgi:hypothetical protein
MNQKVRNMLESMYGSIMQKCQDPLKSWDYFIEFLAADNSPHLFHQINHKFEWFFENHDFAEDIMRIYDFKLLRSDYYDHLGEIYMDKVASKNGEANKAIRLSPASLDKIVSKMAIPRPKNLLKILDPGSESGRFLMAVHKRVPSAMLFGAEPDIRLARIAITNFAIHNIPGFILNADRRIHNIDISTEDGRQNWRFANQWHSCTDKLKPLNNRSNSTQNSQKRQMKNLKNDILPQNAKMD